MAKIPEDKNNQDDTVTARGQVTADAKGKITAPHNIIRTLRGAKAIYHKYRTDHLKRILMYSKIEGLLAGNPPYDPNELAKHKLTHIANFNPLDGRALYERGALAYWNLLNQSENLVKFTFRFPGEQGKDPILVEFADILSRHFNYVIREWQSFNTLMNMLSAQIVKFGISPVVWPDERNWQWQVVDISKFFVQDQAESDIGQLTAVCVETSFTAQMLFDVYETYKDQKQDSSPWNCKELADLLLNMANTSVKAGEGHTDFMSLQRRLQNGDLHYDEVYTDTIKLVTLLYKEYDGKISHYKFHRNHEGEDFIYFVDRQYDNITEALIIFTASPGETTIHSNRGLGHKIFSMTQAMNQLDCSMVDMARLSSTPFLKGLSVGSRDFEQIKVVPGVATHIGTAEFVQTNFGANISQLINLSQYITGKLQYNAANAGDDPSYPDVDKGSISAPEARMRSYKEFGVLKNNIAHFYNLFDRLIVNMVVKMLNSKPGYPGHEYVEEWKMLCLEDGVPEELFDTSNVTISGLPRHMRVKASRVAGDGSTLARIMGLQELGVIASDFGPREANEYRRQWILATLGAEYVPAFLQSSDDDDERAGGASLAGVENAIMQDGHSAIFSRDNEHRSHIATHLALGTDIIRQIQQQEMDAVAADKIFNVLVPHLEEHFQTVAQSPFAQAFVAKVKDPVRQVSEYARLNRKNASAMIQAEIRRKEEQEEQQQELMTDEQIKNRKAEGDEARANMKVQSQLERAERANQTRAEIMKDKVVKDSDNERLKIQLDAKNKMRDVVKQESIEENKARLQQMAGSTPAPNDIEG